MSLKTTTYLCSSCGRPYKHRHPEDEIPRRRWILRCSSERCKGARRTHYPMRRPITGRYR